MFRERGSPLLNKYPLSYPESFYGAFSLVFGKIDDEDEAFLFLEDLNKRMDEEKGGGVIRIREIIYLRKEENIFGGPCTYNSHHVTPLSRGKRPKTEMNHEVVRLPEDFHASWHIVFFNLYDEETILLLEKIFTLLRMKIEIDYNSLQELVGGVMKSRAYRV